LNEKKLKKQKSELETQISTLETELSKIDTTKKIKAIDVIAIPVKSQIFRTYIEVQGRVDAEESVSLSSEMPGMVTKINTKVGEHVSKGDVLAETDTRAMQQQLSDLQINYELAKHLKKFLAFNFFINNYRIVKSINCQIIF